MDQRLGISDAGIRALNRAVRPARDRRGRHLPRRLRNAHDRNREEIRAGDADRVHRRFQGVARVLRRGEEELEDGERRFSITVPIYAECGEGECDGGDNHDAVLGGDGAGGLCDWGVYGDLVEVDAAHDFHSAWVDINHAYKVLRPGGVLFGHDYAWDGVRKAVHIFARLHGFQIKLDGEHWILY
ncbi:hypothetical protein SASPL_157376 [Salvia splendens]|uniref:Class I SAM-dependent methyltransferase n=1 Tax=Salvia splendens TaxID=180675 RepID=A0A8X8YWG8_SALSN|nr:hypothetical protein SASPL_157376 [Salvia splendens]